MRILIVEDEALVAFAIEDALSEARHEVVGIARDGLLALSLADKQNPQLALVDFHLARGSKGDVLAGRLRVLGVPCLFISGHADQCKASAAGGALGCLSKPFLPQDVVTAVSVAEKILNGKDLPEHLPRNLEIYGQRPAPLCA